MNRLFAALLVTILCSTVQAQTWTGNTLEFLHSTLGGNGDGTSITRSDINSDETRLRIRMGDEESSLLEVGYNYYANGQWIPTFTLDGYGNSFFKGRMAVGTTSPYGNSLLHVKSPSTSDWGIISEAVGNRSIVGLGHDGTAGIVSVSYLDGSGYSPLYLKTSNQPRLAVGVNGYVGIGITSPVAKLHINSAVERETFRLYRDGSATNYLSIWQGTGAAAIDPIGTGKLYLGYDQATDVYMGNGTGKVGIGTTTPRGKFDVDGPGDIYLNDDPVNGAGQNIFLPGHIFISPHTSASGIAFLQARRADNSGTTSLRIRTWNSGSLTDAMHIEGNGNIGVGTVTPGSYKLAVEGKIGAREVNVTTNAWSDYVFNSDYKLRPLAEVQQYIEENHHLPEVPSEKEVLANGQNLGEMNAILLKKIEELTLYIIQLKTEHELRDEQQANEIRNLKSIVEKISKQ